LSKSVLAAGAAVLLLAACAKPAPAPAAAGPAPSYDVSIPLKDFMLRVLDPATDVVWGASGVMVDFKGEHDLSPKTDEEWSKLHDAAMVVAESGNLLQLPGRARDGVTWNREAHRVTTFGLEWIKAIDARDKEGVTRIGGDIHAACEECHRVYVLGEAPKP
jgi:hypothetical protein